MIVRFDNFTEMLRISIDNDIDMLHTKYNDEELDEMIIRYFKNMKKRNFNRYSQIVGLMACDQYKNFLIQQKESNLEDYQIERINVYEELYSHDDVLKFIEDDPNNYISLCYEMSEFNNLDYFLKRSVLLGCKYNIETLNKLSFLNVLDYGYYCQKYTVDMFKYLYDEEIKKNFNTNDTILSLNETLENLFLFDIQNYKELIADLLVKYYVLVKSLLRERFDISGYSLYILSILEKCDDIDILNNVSKETMACEILEKCLESNKNFSIDGFQDENSQKTIKKILAIKEI